MKREYIQDSWPHEGTFCWGCGKNNEHGLQLKSYWEDEIAIARWQPKEHHLAFPGVLNGGIISTLIDCHSTGTANAAGHKMFGKDNNDFMYVTASISVNLLQPTPLHTPVTLRAWVKEAIEKRISVSCELYSDDVKCATGEVVCIHVDTKRFLKANSQ